MAWADNSPPRWGWVTLGLLVLLLGLACCSSHEVTDCAAEDGGVCGVCGPIQDCSCTVEVVNAWNRRIFHPQLRELVQRPFFRYFQTNLDATCPLWDDSQDLCSSLSCAISTCQATELPEAVPRDPHVTHVVNARCVEMNNVSQTLDPNLAEPTPHQDAFDFCLRDEFELGAGQLEYIDLLANPEGYTGFSGPAAHRIWNEIYDSNCFIKQRPTAALPADFFGLPSTDPWSMEIGMDMDSGLGFDNDNEALEVDSPQDETSTWTAAAAANVDAMCLEERVFYRLLSGMHASISLHLAHRWYNATADAYLPNATEFLRRFAPEHTAGEGPARLRNLYFTYSTVLRAIVKAQTMWESYPLFGEARDRDGMSTRAAVMQLVQTAQTCDRTFDEHALFQDPESAALADELRAHLRHVSRLMDCVGCRKCRLWGKLQVRGLATALKILFTPFDDLHPDTPLVLARNDVVALFNLWERLASSISFVQGFNAELVASDHSHLQVGDLHQPAFFDPAQA